MVLTGHLSNPPEPPTRASPSARHGQKRGPEIVAALDTDSGDDALPSETEGLLADWSEHGLRPRTSAIVLIATSPRARAWARVSGSSPRAIVVTRTGRPPWRRSYQSRVSQRARQRSYESAALRHARARLEEWNKEVPETRSAVLRRYLEERERR